MKTVEDLMKPRYKVINDYPGAVFPVGKIFKIGSIGSDMTFGEYPHLFKPLQWWEERKESEMPEYVKYMRGDKVWSVYKVVSYRGINIVGNPLCQVECEDPKMGTYDQALEQFIPATPEEYEAYINQKQKA